MRDLDDDAQGPSLRDALARLAGNTLSLVQTRLALAGVEFAEERERLKSQLVLLAVGVVAGGFTLLSATLLVVAHWWDTHREEAIIGLILFYGIVTALALWRASSIRRAAPAPFAATLAELEKDRQRFMRQRVP